MSMFFLTINNKQGELLKMKEQLRREIGKRMRKIRKTLGFTQDQMVSPFTIGRANYSRIEKGEIFPQATILHTLRKKFNISLDWLIADEGEMYPEEKKEMIDVSNFGEYTEEIREMLRYMEEVPMLKHALLGFFIEYKVKNKNIIDQILQAEANRS
jgi:transcriptional regulator with XRE-family HTH domain